MSGIFHISMPYRCKPDHVFVEYFSKKYGDMWRIVPMNSKLKKTEKIIWCSKCDSPAIQLDHFWPGYNDYTLCEKHKGEVKP